MVRCEVVPRTLEVSLIGQRLAMSEIVCLSVLRNRPACARNQILQEFYPGSVRCAQACDPQARAEDIVQMLLLLAIVFARSNDPHSKLIFVERYAFFGIAHCN